MRRQTGSPEAHKPNGRLPMTQPPALRTDA
jgi:hypothetical protein